MEVGIGEQEADIVEVDTHAVLLAEVAPLAFVLARAVGTVDHAEIANAIEGLEQRGVGRGRERPQSPWNFWFISSHQSIQSLSLPQAM